MKRIVADSGPLIAFGRSGLLDLLRQIVGEILVPSTVYSECASDAAKPGAAVIIQARETGLLDVRPDVNAEEVLPESLPSLGVGEIAALALAFDQGCLLLMDERLGRNVAKLHKIPVIGSAGVLLAAKERGLIPEIAPTLLSWRSWGYFLSPGLMEAVLRRAGEKPEDMSSQ
ncbi:MAG: hypothetical protein A3G18_03800 [Rhodospirillales bacterium RIFCSPLOWO2_12_FULL_58_28]|nr:MAG: hypothetical protein A3H92_01740 [Rhodospirillales bacterium RIFCSPLOWO2_02_FULL_58_16]OHC78093.1 MAG: hypothetical protein A3G18_03800 [Rhodospirillales bacterium RIFCSPLOWO2_12_FULL_58_28]